MPLKGIRDVLSYVPVMHSGVSVDGRWAAVVVPRYDALAGGAPQRLAVLDLDTREQWRTLGHPDATFHGAVWAPDSARLLAFRRHGTVADLAILAPEDEPVPVEAMPHAAVAAKWWGEPALPACIGLDDQDCLRVFIWRGVDQPPEAVTPALRRVGDFAFAPCSSRFAWLHAPPRTVLRPTPVNTLHLVRAPGERGVAIRLQEPPLGYLTWSPDGRHLAFLSRPEGVVLCAPRVWVYDTETGESRRLQLGEGWVTGLQWQDSEVLLVTVEQGVCSRVLAVGRGGALRPRFEQDTYISGVQVSHGTGRTLLLRQDGHEPQHVRVAEAGSDLSRRVSQFNKRLRKRALRREELVRWSSDDVPLEGLLMRPEGQPAPLVVWLHGGPAEHLQRTFSAYFQWLCSAGFAVFAPNYRGSTGRDDTFLRSLVGQVGMVDVADVVAGIRHLTHTELVDGHRVGLYGWSYGGSLALHVARAEPAVAALVVGAPVVDWLTVFGAASYPTVTRRYFPDEPWENAAAYDAASPIRDLGSSPRPTLILHGEADVRVPVSQSRLLQRSLQGRGVDCDLRVFPGEGHVLGSPWAVREMLLRTRAWYERYLS